MTVPQWIILAIDPGLTTGYCTGLLWREGDTSEGVTNTAFAGYSFTRLNGGQFGMDEAPETLLTLVRELAHTARELHIPDHRVAVLAEKFVITRTAMQSNATWSSEVTGMVQAIAQLHLPPGYYWDKSQQPSQMKRLIQQGGVMKETGYDKLRQGPHAKDALGHALLFAARYRNGHVKVR